METKKIQKNAQILSKANYKLAGTFVMSKDGSLITTKQHREAIKNKW